MNYIIIIVISLQLITFMTNFIVAVLQTMPQGFIYFYFFIVYVISSIVLHQYTPG
jgi:hypothetical protein